MAHDDAGGALGYRVQMREALTDPRQAWTSISAPERRRIAAHATALGAVAVASLVSWSLGVGGTAAAGSVASGHPAPFLLFTLAVAVSALVGGAAEGRAAALTAVLASTFLARVIASASWPLCALFVIVAGAVAAIVVRLSETLQQHRRWLENGDASLRGTKTAERRGRVVAAAFSRLQDATPDWLAVTLDRDGRIADWGEPAIRLYGVGADQAIGASGAELFGAAPGAEGFEMLLAEARKGLVPRSSGRHVRGDATPFDVDVELRALPPGSGDGFTLLIHDLSGQQAIEHAARLSAERIQGLSDEADLARRQLASIRSVSDPAFDALPGTTGATALLERLSSEVNADGVAIVRAGGYHDLIFSAPDGLQPQPDRLQGENRPQRSRRTVLIHNDPARVTEMTTVGWPDEVRTLIAVPVIRGGKVEAMIEVAYLRGRRSTEWEITLIQVAATRVTGLLHDTAYAKTDAVA